LRRIWFFGLLTAKQRKRGERKQEKKGKAGKAMTALLRIAVPAICLLVVLGQSADQKKRSIDGYLSSQFYDTQDCGSKPWAYTMIATGICVKEFNGPEDPTTELTSYSLDVTAGAPPLLSSTYESYSDSACSKQSQPPSQATLTLDSCVSSKSVDSTHSFKYTNFTTATAPQLPAVDGWSVLGYQEPSSCSAGRELSMQTVYPNDMCQKQSGTTKKGTPFQSYSFYCSGNTLLQTFFTDAACSTPVSGSQAVSIKLGTADTTCYTNQSPDNDLNLFETMVCVGSASPRDEQVASATHVESRKELRRPCPHRHQLPLLPAKQSAHKKSPSF
jgi:hypothetical protein